jgi:hypothetical protein
MLNMFPTPFKITSKDGEDCLSLVFWVLCCCAHADSCEASTRTCAPLSPSNNATLFQYSHYTHHLDCIRAWSAPFLLSHVFRATPKLDGLWL